jgi:hypothetical protein
LKVHFCKAHFLKSSWKSLPLLLLTAREGVSLIPSAAGGVELTVELVRRGGVDCVSDSVLILWFISLLVKVTGARVLYFSAVEYQQLNASQPAAAPQL